MDNTDGYERISLGHWIGSYISLDWEGDVITKAHNNIWQIADKSRIAWIKENDVQLTKNNVSMVDGEEIRFIGGDSAYYFAKKGVQDYNFEGGDPFIETSKGEVDSSAIIYFEFGSDLKYKFDRSWVIDITEDFKLKIAGDHDECTSGSKTVNVGGILDVSSGGIMNLNAPVIKLNCGGPATADCGEVTDPLSSDPTTPDRKEQGEISNIEDVEEAFVEMYNFGVGAECDLLKPCDLASEV